MSARPPGATRGDEEVFPQNLESTCGLTIREFYVGMALVGLSPHYLFGASNARAIGDAASEIAAAALESQG